MEAIACLYLVPKEEMGIKRGRGLRPERTPVRHVQFRE